MVNGSTCPVPCTMHVSSRRLDQFHHCLAHLRRTMLSIGKDVRMTAAPDSKQPLAQRGEIGKIQENGKISGNLSLSPSLFVYIYIGIF